jgi:ATP-dependent HslUV protease ATP-binding subunit HslU
MAELTPRQIVRELDKYIVGQEAAKRAVAVALRNRYRRQQLPPEIAENIAPKNIMLIGPTGVGKTEIARRLAKLADAPFVKVEATKFTEVGYVGRDVESIIRDLMDTSVAMIHEQRMSQVQEQADGLASERILNYLIAEREARLQGGEREEPPEGRPAEPRPGAPAVAAAVAEGGRKVRRARRAVSRRERERLAEKLRQKELEDHMIEIEVETDEAGPMLEFVTGMASEEVGENFQELLSSVGRSQRRRRQVSVREARRILAQEEANKLIDWDDLMETAVRRVEEDGIVFLDELDKLATTGPEIGGPDVSGAGVQRDLLPIVEGSVVQTRFGPVKTDHILFLAAGAFHQHKPSDLIPELQGRFPLRVELQSLTGEDYVRILTEPEHALTKQYQALLATEGVTLEFTPEGVRELAAAAYRMNATIQDIGARRLSTVVENVLEDLSFEASDRSGASVIVDAAYVREKLGDLLTNVDLSRYIL